MPECDVIFGSSLMMSLSKEELSNEYEWHYRVFSEGDSTEQELRPFMPSTLNEIKNMSIGVQARGLAPSRC